jgi:hypothetical protein
MKNNHKTIIVIGSSEFREMKRIEEVDVQIILCHHFFNGSVNEQTWTMTRQVIDDKISYQGLADTVRTTEKQVSRLESLKDHLQSPLIISVVEHYINDALG